MWNSCHRSIVRRSGQLIAASVPAITINPIVGYGTFAAGSYGLATTDNTYEGIYNGVKILFGKPSNVPSSTSNLSVDNLTTNNNVINKSTSSFINDTETLNKTLQTTHPLVYHIKESNDNFQIPIVNISSPPIAKSNNYNNETNNPSLKSPIKKSNNYNNETNNPSLKSPIKKSDDHSQCSHTEEKINASCSTLECLNNVHTDEQTHINSPENRLYSDELLNNIYRNMIELGAN